MPAVSPATSRATAISANARCRVGVGANRFGARVAPPARAPRHHRRPRTAAATDDASSVSSAGDDASTDPDSSSPAMFDNLIKIFLNREEKDWVGLLASSERWPTLREGFFARLKSRAADEEDPEEMLRLSRLLRLMQGTSERVAAYADLLAEVQDTDEDLWEGMVTNRRAEFTTEFFQFLRFKLEAMVRAQASASTARAKVAKAAEKDADAIDGEVTDDDKARLKGERAVEKETEDAADAERDALARTAARLISICEAFDEATKDQETLEEAAENFKELLEVETLEEMNQKIEEMSQQGKMDPALVLTAAKAYMSVKESPYVEEEVKDVMAHLYFKMKETMGRQQPKEVRILKFLLAMEDPREIRNGLEEAFTPGPELTTEDEDYLFCEAPALLKTIDAVLNAYEQQQGKASITGQAAELMQPEVIEKMKTIKGQIEANFL
jgi:hypothetical protein